GLDRRASAFDLDEYGGIFASLSGCGSGGRRAAAALSDVRYPRGSYDQCTERGCVDLSPNLGERNAWTASRCRSRWIARIFCGVHRSCAESHVGALPEGDE